MLATTSRPFPPRGPSARWRISTLLAVGLLALAATAEAQIPTGAPVVTVAAPGNGGSSDTLFVFGLGDGSAVMADQLGRDPLSPRLRRLDENLFTVIGRAAGQAAFAGEILLGPIHWPDRSVRAALYVETTIGYVAYFNQIGKNGSLGEVITVIGRPFESIAADDGNFALLMRRERSGRTEGAYLYHATTGRGVYCFDMSKLDPDLKIQSTSALPALAGPVSAAPTHQGSEATAGYVITDAATGDVYFFDLGGQPDRFTIRQAGFNLFTAIAQEGDTPSPRRFQTVPIQSGANQTAHVLVLDAATGQMALIENVTAPAPVLTPIPRDLDDALGAAAGERIFAAVPDVDGGATRGVWVVDSRTGRMLYVGEPATPSSLTVQRVTF